MKPRSTQRKKSAVARASQSAGRSDYRAWSGGIAALLEEQICPTVSGKSSGEHISQTASAEFEICGTASHKTADAQKLPTPLAKSPVPISATLSRKSTGPIYETPSRNSYVGLAFGDFNGESQRDSGLKPKVARNELPWVSISHVNNPNGVVARRRKRGATPLGLRTFTATTQGSSFLATLGWMTQSRWDCRGQTIFRTAPSSFLQLPFSKGIRTKTVSQRTE